MKTRIRTSVLILFGTLASLYPFLSYINAHSEWLTALNISPYHTLFLQYPFFSRIDVSLKFQNETIETNSANLYVPNNHYADRNLYSLFYVPGIFKTEDIQNKVMLWYLCNPKHFHSQINYISNLEEIRVSYVHRRTGEVLVVKDYSCKASAQLL